MDIIEQTKEEYEFEQKLCKLIEAMPDNLALRFKLLKIVSDRRSKLQEEHTAALKQIEVRYVDEKKPLYLKRQMIISGDCDPDEDTDSRFQSQFLKLKGQVGNNSSKKEDSEAVEVDVSDVKEQRGIPGFWLRVLKNHHLV